MPVPAMRIFWEAMLPSDEDVRSFKLARALNASLRHAHEEMGRFWHENILPNHFGAAGKVRYHYQPRSERYKRWKQRSQGKLRWARLPGGQRYQYRVVGGADDDNILSGRLRDKMIGSPAAYRARVISASITGRTGAAVEFGTSRSSRPTTFSIMSAWWPARCPSRSPSSTVARISSS